MRIFRIFSQ